MTLTRRNLPHLHFEYGLYFVTFRLFDSLPSFYTRKVREETIHIKDPEERAKTEFLKIDHLLDDLKLGKAYLKDNKVADVVKHCLHYPDKKEYNLICYSILSNHVHAIFDLLEGNKGLSKIMQSIKGISANRSNKIIGRSGMFWQDESYDRLLRNEKEFSRSLNYVLNNPVKAGLVNDWKCWKNNYCNPDFLGYVTER